MPQGRRVHGPAFKAKVALEALKGRCPPQAQLPIWRQLELTVHLLFLTSLLGNDGPVAGEV